ncbi:MAG: hypothetical protein VXZ82_12780 [Planctomycetota bacterium]|nr:hypothetical protein [Planctomycetota bacterium]
MMLNPRMLSQYSRLYLAASFAFFLALQAPRVNAQTLGAEQAASMLPGNTIVFAEVQDLSHTVDLVLDHPIRDELEELPTYQQLFASPQYLAFRGGVALLEASMGQPWPEIVATLSAGGIYFAAEPTDESVALLIHAENGKSLDTIRRTLFPFIRSGAKKGSVADPIRTTEINGFKVYSIRNDGFLADLDDWYVLSNKKPFIEQIVRLRAAGSSALSDTFAQKSLLDTGHFKEAMQLRPENFLIWSYVDAATLRESGEAVALYSGKTDNPLAEMLFGGVMSTLKRTGTIAASLQVEQSQLQLSVSTPHDRSWVGEDREYFFGENGDAQAPGLAKTENQVFALSSYRDLSQMWLRAADLMTEQAAEGMAQAESQLAIFFSGKDFGEDILGALGPNIQLVASQQDFGNLLPRPAIKLPSFGLKFDMLAPEKTTKEFRRVFQSLVGFINIFGAMEGGNPPFDMDWQRKENYEIISVSYASDLEGEEAEAAPIYYNFAPAIVFTEDKLVLASTKLLAEELASVEQETDTSNANTAATLDAGILHAILLDNQDQLIAQNMLENGHSREQAQAEIGLLMQVLNFIKGAETKLLVAADRLELRTTLKLHSGISAEKAP